MTRSVASLVLGTSLLCCVHVPAKTVVVTRGAARAEAITEPFTLVVWNVHKEPGALEDELPSLAEGASLVLVQEGMGPELDMHGVTSQVVAFRYVRGGGMTGVLTWSRDAPRTSTALRTRQREPLVQTPKSALVSEHALADGTRLLVANLHGINFRPAGALQRQLASLEAVLAPHDGPMIVGGDFNTWSKRRRAVVEAFVARLGLARVFAGPIAPKLDAVFVRGLVVREARMVDTEHSDHDALVVTVER